MSQTISVVSGKGGVGKSTLTANLGKALADYGSSVLIIDTDIGLRSQDFLLSLENQVVYDLIDITKGNCETDQAILSVPAVPRLSLIPAAQFSRVKSLEPKELRKMISSLRAQFDFILIDCPAGIDRGFRNVLSSGSDAFILVTTPDDLCIRDAERTLQIMNAKKIDHPWLIVNRLDNNLIYRGEMISAQAAASVLDCPLLGEIPEDQAVYRAMLHHALFADYQCEARKAVYRIAARLRGGKAVFPEYGTRKPSFRSRLFRTALKEVTPLDNH